MSPVRKTVHIVAILQRTGGELWTYCRLIMDLFIGSFPSGDSWGAHSILVDSRQGFDYPIARKSSSSDRSILVATFVAI